MSATTPLAVARAAGLKTREFVAPIFLCFALSLIQLLLSIYSYDTTYEQTASVLPRFRILRVRCFTL